MSDWMEIAVTVLANGMLILGAFCVLTGGIGVLRMPEFFTRMHAASLTDTMATLLLFFGLMLHAGFSLVTFKLFAIMAFLLFTGPTATYALANSALSTGLTPSEMDDAADQAEEAL